MQLLLLERIQKPAWSVIKLSHINDFFDIYIDIDIDIDMQIFLTVEQGNICEFPANGLSRLQISYKREHKQK